MRIFNVQQPARPVPVDRPGASNKAQYVNTGAVAPHAATQRWSYTVPVNKKAQVQASNMQESRATAATTASLIQDYLLYTPSGGAGEVVAIINLVTNGVNDNNAFNAPSFGDMLVGDSLSYWTSDGSTGGTVGHLGGAKVFEYPA